MFSFGFFTLTVSPVTYGSLNRISLGRPFHLTHTSRNKLHVFSAQVLKLTIQGNPDNLPKGHELLLQATTPLVMPLTDSLHTLSINSGDKLITELSRDKVVTVTQVAI